MHIALVGASGFVGRHLARRAASLGHDVTGLGRHRPSDLPDGMTWRMCDLTAPEPVPVPSDTDVVFYLAQSAHYRDFPEHADDLFAVNAQGVVRTAQAACAAHCRLFCHASTGSVYAPSFAPLSEASPVAGRSAYAASKLMGESAAACFRNHMTVCSVRIFSVYGPGEHSMLPWVLLRRVISGQPVRLEEGPEGMDGGLKISFIYTDDLVDRLLCLADRAVRGESVPPVLNMAGPEAVSLRDFAEGLARELRRDVLSEPAAPRDGDLRADTCLCDQICQMPYHSLTEGLHRMCERYSAGL